MCFLFLDNKSMGRGVCLYDYTSISKHVNMLMCVFVIDRR